MTAITAANISNPEFVAHSSSFHNRESSRGISLPKLAKTAGVLALLLSGGARAENPSAFQGNRRLMNTGYIPEPEPYDYISVCDNGISEPYVAGTNREDCMVQEQIELDVMKASKSGRMGRLEKCYKVSGYLTAAMFGGSLVTLAAAEEGVRGSAAAATVGTLTIGGGFSLLSTAICGFMHMEMQDRIGDSEDAAKECCEIFPTQEEIAASEARDGNSTVVATPPPANNSMPINGTTDSARRR